MITSGTLLHEPPPIRHMPGCGLIARLYQRGGEHRERVLVRARQLYSEGVQYAFCYYEERGGHAMALRRLADAFVEDVMSMSDEEVLAEFREDHEDPERHAAEMRALFEKTITHRVRDTDQDTNDQPGMST